MKSRSLWWRGYLLVVLAVLLNLTTCSNKDSPTEPLEPPTVSNLTVIPDSAPPSATVLIEGLTLVSTSGTPIELYINDQMVPYSVLNDTVLAILPLFLDSTGWSSPPAGPQDIEIRQSGKTVAVAPDAVTITPLLKAPGTTERVKESLDSIIASYEAIFSLISINDSAEGPVRDGVFNGLRALISGGDSSLASILDGSSSVWNGQPVDVELLDALLASSGIAAYYESYASLLGNANRLTQKVAESAGASGVLCTGTGEDYDLACKMQIYVVLSYFSQEVVAPTARTWANLVGRSASIIGIVGKEVPAVAIISAILSIADFVMQDIAPAMLPSHITDFSITFDQDTIAVGDMTSSTITMTAVNTPTPISLNEVINVAVSVIPLLPNEQVNEFKAILLRAFNFVLDQYRGALLDYEAQHPGTYTDPTLGSIPAMTWGPVEINSADLVQLYSYTQDIVEADETAFEWHALKNGEGRVEGRTRGPGARSKVLNDGALCFGCVYTGGAFGENSEKTETKSIWVGDKGQIHVFINGLPDGTDGAVTMNGPSGTYSVPQTKLFKDLKIGEYTLIATEVRGTDNEVYKPDLPLQRTIILKPGDSASVAYNYTKKNGRLSLSIFGLPSGGLGDVDLLNSNGSVIGNYTETNIITDLAPGDYTVLAHPVTINSKNYDPAPESQVITIVAGNDSAASVTYSETLSGIGIRNWGDAKPGHVGVRTCFQSDYIYAPTGVPNIHNPCDGIEGLVSYLPFSGSAGVTCSYGNAQADLLITSSSANSVTINESVIVTASDGYANISGGYIVDIYNTKLDTLQVTIEWTISGAGSYTSPYVKAWTNGTIGIKEYDENCELVKTQPFVDSSGVGAWTIDSSFVDTITRAYTKIRIDHDLLSESKGNQSASALAHFIITTIKLNQ